MATQKLVNVISRQNQLITKRDDYCIFYYRIDNEGICTESSKVWT